MRDQVVRRTALAAMFAEWEVEKPRFNFGWRFVAPRDGGHKNVLDAYLIARNDRSGEVVAVIHNRSEESEAAAEALFKLMNRRAQ